MSSFPGVIYDGQGKSLDPTVPDLVQEQLDGCPHRSMVTDRTLAPVARVWLLANDATPDAIHPVLMIEAVKLGVQSRSVMAQLALRQQGTSYGPGSPRQRHND